MKVRVQIPVKDAKKLKEKVIRVLKTKYSEEFDAEYLEIVSFMVLEVCFETIILDFF